MVAVTKNDEAHTILFFFFNDTATTEIYTLSLHDALPILPKIIANEDIEKLTILW